LGYGTEIHPRTTSCGGPLSAAGAGRLAEEAGFDFEGQPWVPGL
jgi:hypothetical protein